MKRSLQATLLVGLLLAPSAQAGPSALQMALPGFDSLGDMQSITDTLGKACTMVRSYENLDFICTISKTATYIENLMDGGSWLDFGNELLANFIGAQISGLDTGDANKIADDLFNSLKTGVNDFKKALTKLSMTSFTASLKPSPEDDETEVIAKRIMLGNPTINQILQNKAKEQAQATAAKGELVKDLKDAADAFQQTTTEVANQVERGVKIADKVQAYNDMVQNATSTRELMQANVLAMTDLLSESKTNTMSVLGTLSAMLKQQVVTNKMLNAQVQEIYNDKLNQVGDLEAEIQQEIIDGQQKQKELEAFVKSNKAISLTDLVSSTDGVDILDPAKGGF